MIKKLFFWAFIFLSLTSNIFSQTADQINHSVRQVDNLTSSKMQEPLKTKPQEQPEITPPQSPESVEGENTFLLKKVNLVGVESFKKSEFSSIIKKYEQKKVTFNDLQNLAKEIENYYIYKGTIAVCFIPEQELDLEKAEVIVQVVEAKMGKLHIPEHKYFDNSRLSCYWKIDKGEPINYDKMSQSLQLMGVNPSRSVQATMVKGKTPGTTDILLDPKVSFPIRPTFTYDREGDALTGVGRPSLGLRHNNFLGLDDSLIAGFSQGRDFSGVYLYHSIPLNCLGTSLFYGFSKSKSSPKKEFEIFGIRSQAQSVNLSLRQVLFRGKKYFGEIFGGIDFKDKDTHLITGTQNRDRLRILRLGGDFVYQGRKSVTTYSTELSQGINAFGATSDKNPLASRGAKSVFSKFNTSLLHRRRFFTTTEARLKMSMQLAGTNLMPQEQFALGGIDSVRGYPSGDFLADNAVFVSAEILLPYVYIPGKWKFPFEAKTIRKRFTPILFVDYGRGVKKRALSTEQEDITMWSFGCGLRANLTETISLRLEFGIPFGDDTISEQAESYLHFSLKFQ